MRDRIVPQLLLKQFNLFVDFDTTFFGNLHGIPLALSSASAGGILSTVVCCYGQVAGNDGVAAFGVGLDMLNLELAVDVSFHDIGGRVVLLACTARGAVVRHCEVVCLQV